MPRQALAAISRSWPGTVCWLEGLLGAALPEEAVSLASLEFRHEPAGLEDPEVDRLHADGSYIRSVCTLYGPGTVYRDGREERPVPDGQTLLMTAMDRARAVRRAVYAPPASRVRAGAGGGRVLVRAAFGTVDAGERLPRGRRGAQSPQQVTRRPVQIRPPQLEGLEVLRPHAALVSAEDRVRPPAGPLRGMGTPVTRGEGASHAPCVGFDSHRLH